MQKNKLGFKSLFLMLTGTMIGPSIVVYVGFAMGATGFSVWISVVLGMVLGAALYMPMYFMSSHIKLRGGTYSVICALGNKQLAGAYAYAQLTTYTGISSLAVAAASYICSVATGLNPSLVAAFIATLFYILNLFNTSFISKIQNVMTAFLVICLGMFVVVGIGKINQPIFDFSNPQFFSGGGKGLFTAIGLMCGMGQTVQYAVSFTDIAENPKRDIPKIMITVPVFLTIFYLLICFVAEGVLPLEDVSNLGHLTNQAMYVLGPTLGLVFVVLGPVMALLTSLNGFFVGMSAPLITNARNGWFPKALTKTNRFGSHWVVMTVLYAVAMIPIITGLNLTQIAQNGMLMSSAAAFILIICYFRFPTVYKDQIERGEKKFNKSLYYAFAILAFIAETFIVVYSATSLTITIAIFSVCMAIAAVVLGLIRSRSENVEIKSAVTVD